MTYVAWISIRLLFSYVFLNAAWQCGKNRQGREWTVNESRILFGDAAGLFGPLGIVAMAIGGLSILLGICAEFGGILLTVFLAMGAAIHFSHSKRASELQTSISSEAEDQSRLTELAVSAQLGHYSSAIKNISLMGPSIFFAIMGSGPYSCCRLWGLA